MELGKQHMDNDSYCAWCARMKRGVMYSTARREGYNVLALAQHLDDLAESFLMSAFHGGQLRTMKAHYTIRDGDLLVWYTDGLVECTDGSRTQFGNRRMQRLLRKAGSVGDPRAVRDQLIRAAYGFMGGNPPDDDITLVVARIDPPA